MYSTQRIRWLAGLTWINRFNRRRKISTDARPDYWSREHANYKCKVHAKFTHTIIVKPWAVVGLGANHWALTLFVMCSEWSILRIVKAVQFFVKNLLVYVLIQQLPTLWINNLKFLLRHQALLMSNEHILGAYIILRFASLCRLLHHVLVNVPACHMAPPVSCCSAPDGTGHSSHPLTQCADVVLSSGKIPDGCHHTSSLCLNLMYVESKQSVLLSKTQQGCDFSFPLM